MKPPRIDEPTARSLPSSYARSNQNAPKVRDVHGLFITMDRNKPSYYTDTGKSIPQNDILDWLLGKNVYTNVKSAGLMDVVLRHLPPFVLWELADKRRTSYGGLQIWRSATHNDASITVRRGNQTGILINANILCGDETDPKQVASLVERALATFAKHGLVVGDMRSAGHAADQLMNKFSRFNGKAWWTKRPDDLTQWMFLQSFRGARIESTTFGSIGHVNDYDISSAYGWAMAQLPNTRHMDWVRSADLGMARAAGYGVILCDVQINPSLRRGPIAYRCGESHLFYPVGPIEGAWLNLPEIKLLLEHPELGTITKVHEGVWGIPQFADEQYQPFKPMIEALYKLRSSEPWMNGYPKAIMVSTYGKTLSEHNGEVGRHFNPVISSAITSMIRARNYVESLENEVCGEWTDGFASTGRIEQDSRIGFGRLRLEGSGRLLIAADAVKEAAWKRTETGTGESVAFLLNESRDNTDMRWCARYNIGLTQMYRQGLGPEVLGLETVDTYRFPLGSHVRLATGPMRGGDLLNGAVETLPPKQSQLAMLMAEWMERGLKIA